MSPRVIVRDRDGILRIGELLLSAIPEVARFRGCVTFKPLDGMPKFIDCKETDATESEALQRAKLLANHQFAATSAQTIGGARPLSAHP